MKFFSFVKRTSEKVFDIKYGPAIGLSVSPDGRYVLFTQDYPFFEDLNARGKLPLTDISGGQPNIDHTRPWAGLLVPAIT